MVIEAAQWIVEKVRGEPYCPFSAVKIGCGLDTFISQYVFGGIRYFPSPLAMQFYSRLFLPDSNITK